MNTLFMHCRPGFEGEVCSEIAEHAARLNVSPNTVKTHVARVLEKLEVSRRTAALARARELGLLP